MRPMYDMTTNIHQIPQVTATSWTMKHMLQDLSILSVCIYLHIHMISIIAIHVGTLASIQLYPTDPALFKVQIRGYWSLSAEAGAANLGLQPNWIQLADWPRLFFDFYSYEMLRACSHSKVASSDCWRQYGGSSCYRIRPFEASPRWRSCSKYLEIQSTLL